LRISRKKPKKFNTFVRYRINQQIRVPELRIIDENGNNLGIMKTFDALNLAGEKDLDLVEVSPLTQPPVAKIVNYSKLKYEEEKEQRKLRSKQKKTETKIIRLSLRIGQHDKKTRKEQAKKFLSDDDKIKIELLLRGRERQHVDLAKQIINEFIAELSSDTGIKIEQPLNRMGAKLDILISKK